MLEPINLETNLSDLKIPQSPSSQSADKIKDHNKTKKAFKIKKHKIYNTKKHLHEQFFTDPLYEGLENQQHLNENKLNFGPWVHSDKHHSSPVKIKDSYIDPEPNPYLTHLRSDSNHEPQSQSRILTPTNFQNDESNPVNPLPEIKFKRQLHELRFSSLALQLPKNSKLSPLKFEKNRSVQISQKQRQPAISMDFIRYESMKYLPSNDKYFEVQNHSRPNNVIFNYCCFSNSQNDVFSKDLPEKNTRNWLNKNGNFNKSTRNFSLTKHNNFRLQQKKDKINKISQIENTLSPLKKTISQELYAQLIQKKNRRK